MKLRTETIKLLGDARARKCASNGAFSLVEITVAMGLAAYCLLAMLGVFAVGLNSSRDSSTETTLSQIALHASSSYRPTDLTEFNYSEQGSCLGTSATAVEKYYTATVTENSSTAVPNASANLRLLTVAITSVHNPKDTHYVQASAYIQ